MEYFKPRFLLGLTATPERMDGRNIYALCDYNVPYEIGLKDAINKGMLVPFHYYGILDETVDYSKIRIVKGKYDEEELTKEFIKGRQYELIYKYYMKYRSKGRWDFAVHADMRSRWQRNSAVAIFRRQLYTAIQTASMLLREVKQ